MKKMVIMAMGMLMASSVGANSNLHYTPIKNATKINTHHKMVTPYQKCVMQQQNAINSLSKQFGDQCMSTSDHCKKLHNNFTNARTIAEMNKFATEYGKECALSTTFCNDLKKKINKFKEKQNVNVCYVTTCQQQLKQMQQYANSVIKQQIQQYNSLSTKYQGLIGLCNEHNIIIPMDLR